jgi:peptidoglycan/LPS O-acetylase OafA/YrhL
LIDLDNVKFSAWTFYARRVRRIFPALIVVLGFTFALGWHFLLPAELTSLGKNLVASALFSANLMLLSEVGYFDIAARTKPLLHLWSLGIEEQFYLLWPWILWLLPRRRLIAGIIAMIIGSFALNIAMVTDHPSSAFYLPFPRAWELLVGALLTQIPRQSQRIKEALGVCGLSAVLVSLFLFDAHTKFPGWAAAVPVIGSAFLIISEGSIVSRLTFTHRTAVNVGLISYPLYLWHWPLLVFAEIYKFRPLTELQRGLVIGATFVLAWLTYKLLERPIRIAGNTYIKPLIASMAVLAIVAVAPALGYVPALPDDIARLITVPGNGAGWRVGECMLLETDVNDFSSDCADQKRPLVAIWGDSTAAALIPGFRMLQDSHPFGLAQYTVSSCPPVLLRPTPVKHCLERNGRIVDLLGAVAPDVVLLHAIWNVNDRAEDLRPTVTAIRKRHPETRIIILGPVPVWQGGLPNAVAANFWRTGKAMPERTPFYFDRASADGVLRKIAEELNVEYISARDVFCNSDGCLDRIGDSLVASDIVHLTKAGSAFLANAIFDKMHGLRSLSFRPQQTPASDQ